MSTVLRRSMLMSLLLGSLMFPMTNVWAADAPATPTPKTAAAAKGSSSVLVNPLGAGTTIFSLINRVVKAFLGMVGAFALAVFVYAGITWMTAGSSDRIQKAQDAMKYAVMGLALIAFSYTITTLFLTSLTSPIEVKTNATAPVEATQFTQ